MKRELEKQAEDKGLFEGSCNRQACQRPGATYFNLYTNRFYCGNCAHLINKANERDTIAMYGRRHAVFDVTAPYAPGEPLEDGAIVGIQTDGRLVQWDSGRMSVRHSGETLAEYGRDNLTDIERQVFANYLKR